MKRSQLVNLICSLILASLLVLAVLLIAVFAAGASRTLVIESDSASAVYNDQDLTAPSWRLVSGNLKSGHMLNVEVKGVQRDVGSSQNIFYVKVVDSSGQDVTSDYNVKTIYGDFKVIPIALTVKTKTANKQYDGTPLTENGWSYYPEDALIAGHTLEVVVNGSQTEIGISDNTVASVAVYDAYGKNVTGNYDISFQLGSLVVYDPNGLNSGSVGGGSSIDVGGNIGSGNNSGGNVLCLRVKNEITDTVYLKLKSFGAYTGKAWKDAEQYDQLIDGAFSADYLSSIALNQTDSYIEIRSFADQYFLPYYMSRSESENYEIQKSDVIYSGNAENVYSLYYGKFDYTSVSSLPSTYRKYEKAYRSFVNGQYLEIDDVTLEYMKKIIKEKGFYGNDLKTVLKVAKYIQSSATYSLNYDRALDDEDNIAVAFLDKYKMGICQHYASAATLLYRAMGIPARYTVGFYVEARENEWVDVYGSSAHAWVEVYIKDMGWVQIEVTGGFDGSGGGSGELKYSATVSPVYVDKKYDGTPLYAENKVDGFEKFEEMGFTYEAVISGSRTELGKSTSVIESFIIYDRYGNDITDTFDLTLKDGTVHVYISELIFESGGASKEYDGKQLSTDLSTCRLVGGTVRDGDSFNICEPVYIVDVSNVSAGFKVLIMDKNGDYVTDIYKITKKCGTLSITPRNITVKAADATKKYDGLDLIDNSYEIISGSLNAGDFVSYCVVEGSQRVVGRSDNIVKEIIIVNRLGVDVTKNYCIELKTGVLRVTP